MSGPFKVSISTMKESVQGTSYLVTLDNANRSANATLFDSFGRITPFQHSNLSYVRREALAWALFLGCDAHDEKGILIPPECEKFDYE